MSERCRRDALVHREAIVNRGYMLSLKLRVPRVYDQYTFILQAVDEYLKRQLKLVRYHHQARSYDINKRL